jgi:hypothetical protein
MDYRQSPLYASMYTVLKAVSFDTRANYDQIKLVCTISQLLVSYCFK